MNLPSAARNTPSWCRFIYFYWKKPEYNWEFNFNCLMTLTFLLSCSFVWNMKLWKFHLYSVRSML